MWLIALLLFSKGVYGIVYLVTREGRVPINEAEYFYHNSDLKLMCLTSIYSLGAFQPSMLYIEQATTREIADLPVKLYWSKLDSEEFYRLAQRTELAQLLNRLYSDGKLIHAWRVIREAFRKHSSELSKALQLDSLCGPILKQLLDLIDPCWLMLQYSGKLAAHLARTMAVGKETQPEWLWEFFFHHFPSELVVDFVRLAQIREDPLDPLEVWKYLEENHNIQNNSNLAMSALVTTLIDSIDYSKLTFEQLDECIRRYTGFTGLVVRLGLFGKPSALGRYVQYHLDLSTPTSFRLLYLNGVGETCFLLERVKPEWVQLAEAPAEASKFRCSLLSGHLSPGWVENVLVPSKWFQQGIFWAMTWKADFLMSIELCNDILLNLNRFKSGSALIMVVLAHLKRHPKDFWQLKLDSPRHAKNMLDWRVLDAFMDYHGLSSPIEIKDSKETDMDESHWNQWSEEVWRKISDEKILDLVLSHGLAPIYNQLSPSSRQALGQRLTRATFKQPGFSSSIRLGQIDESLAVQFINLMTPLFETASLWENVTQADIEMLLQYWPCMRAKFINGAPSKMVNYIKEQLKAPILTTTRRPFDYIQDIIASNPGIRENSMLVEMSDAHWKNLPIGSGPFHQELKDFLTCPLASKRRHKYQEHPFWIALHETIDLNLLGEMEWMLIGSMAKERNLEPVLLAGYLMGCPVQLPPGLAPGLPFPSWMADFSQSERFAWLEPVMEANMNIQKALLLAIKWNAGLVLPECLVDLIATKHASAGWRKDVALLVLEYKLKWNPQYRVSVDAPINTSILKYLTQ